MINYSKRINFIAFSLLALTAATVEADPLFSNWSSGVVGGSLYTSGGPCSFASCFALEDNFSNPQDWMVTGFTLYIVSIPSVISSPGWRYALFSAGGDQIVAPTDSAIVATEVEAYDAYKIYKIEISGLNISLPAGEYWLRFTNTQSQAVFPAYGMSPSAQTLSPGFRQLTGSSTVEALLSTEVTQRSENWAFEVSGTSPLVFSNGFETP